MYEGLKEKTKEALSSVLPISAIVLILASLIVPLSIDTVVMFLAGAMLLVLGMGLFSLGADMSMMPIGESVGRSFGHSKSQWFVTFACFLLGFIITIAEPDLSVLAGQVSAISDMVLILTVASGVGIFLVIAMLHIQFGIQLSTLLYIFYGIIFALSIFTPNNFVAVAFDAGGVTTGPITVPFILSMGIGLASARSGKNSQDDSFGFVALCSIGPILAVMLLGILYNPQEATYDQVIILKAETMRDVWRHFFIQLPAYFKEVLLALIPISIFFAVFQIISRSFTRRKILKICVGLVYTMVGLVLFLTGVNVGFIPVGSLLGGELAGSPLKWLLIPIGMLIGYYIVKAEPAIHVLNKQVEEITSGAINRKAMNLCLSIGVALSVGLSMLRVLTGISIYWFVIPGYLTALFLTRFVPKIFTGIAFDSGGVASGPMTSTFLLPLVMGACEAIGGNVMTDAFGIVALVAMTPPIAIQLMGLIYQIKLRKSIAPEPLDDEVIDEIVEELMQEEASENE